MAGENVQMNPNEYNLSTRYVLAMRQLPQYQCCMERSGASITHALTGVRVSPLGTLNDPDDVSGLLEVVYPGGSTATVIGALFFKLALREAAKTEVDIHPGDFGLLVRSSVQKRIADLHEHFTGKYGLDES